VGANVIVTCDVLNAVGAGMSLKFLDLFLLKDYNVSPAGVFFVAFLVNIFGAFLTPLAKSLLTMTRDSGYKAKLMVACLWTVALLFLGLLCVPGMPLCVVVVSIVMMQSLNSCTKAYNRAQLVNYLPRDKIATYMTWDALNKANQGGVAIFGAQIVEFGGGYRACFLATFCILLVRVVVYLAFALRKGTVLRGSVLLQEQEQQQAASFYADAAGEEAHHLMAGECSSQLFSENQREQCQARLYANAAEDTLSFESYDGSAASMTTPTDPSVPGLIGLHRLSSSPSDPSVPNILGLDRLSSNPSDRLGPATPSH